MRHPLPRSLTVRYISALLVVAGLLLAGQLVVQLELDRQEDDARIVNISGRQRMLSQRLCMLLLARVAEPEHAATLAGEARQVADEWEASQEAFRSLANSDAVRVMYEGIADDHRAMLDAARSADSGGAARAARAHQDAFLAGMDRIVAEYAREARARVIALRKLELALFALALVVLALEGAFVFRPAVRALRAHLAARDRGEAEIVTVSDREQRDLAHDLHDGLCQQLVGISFLVKSLQPTASEAQHEPLDEIGRLLGGAIDQTRGMARTLHSPALDAGGLPAALRELGRQTERVYGVPCQLSLGEGALPEGDAANHLYRIAREAVVNAAKHAKPGSIEIDLARRGGEVVLAIRDDGVGISSPPIGGLGLHMMEYRAKMIGAVLSVASGEGRGTVVTCSLAMPV